MKADLDRRRFLKIAGVSMGVGALYTVWPGLGGSAEATETARRLGLKTGEKPTTFTFAQLSDAHVGFDGPIGTRALEQAVDSLNALPQRPDLILFTGDLTHDTEKPGEHAARMKRFQEISSRLAVAKVFHVPGEHDAGLDGGDLYRSVFGPTYYSFDHRGVHFVALDNVSRARPEVGAEQRAWLARDLARFHRTAPIVVFTHRPLFDLRPDWEWFTSDGDEVMSLLAPYENVTVLYGHIHREDHHTIGSARHHAARSLSFAFPDPAQVDEKKAIPFDKDQPFKNLGLRVVEHARGSAAGADAVRVQDVELTMKEYSGTEGFNQLLKPASL
ncbi:MAG: serine/threonine protein phosphatase [Acidobacteria bacterium]|nr:MAG: serine/threonine protein phosphatase [Acidobacteriota bacterium]